MYGILGVIILILYIFVLSCIIQEEQRKRQEQYRSLHQLGVSLKQLSKARFCEGIINSLYMLISIPVLYYIWMRREQANWSDDMLAYTSRTFDKTIWGVTKTKYVFYATVDDVNIKWMLIFLAVMIAIVILMHGKNSIKMKRG